MNIAVINLKDMFKYLIKIVIIICLFIGVTNFLKSISLEKQEETIKEKIDNKTKEISNYTFTNCLDISLSLLSYYKEDDKSKTISTVNSLLSLELGMLDKEILKSTDLNINEEELTLDDVEELENKIIEVEANVTTQKVEENNMPEVSTNYYGTVAINNSSDYTITEEMMIPNVEITNKKDIFIYHTHTCESYTPSEEYNYEMTGNYRTTDLNYTVARVGDELSTYLTQKEFNVTHNKTYHDYPAYSGSYSRSLETAQNNLAGKDTQIVIDLHRDAIGSNDAYAPTIKMNDTYAAQLMFVIRNRWRRVRTS